MSAMLAVIDAAVVSITTIAKLIISDIILDEYQVALSRRICCV